MQKHDLLYYLKKISQGIILSLVALAILFTYNKDVILGEYFLYETMPSYKIDKNIKMLFKFNTNEAEDGDESLLEEAFASSDFTPDTEDNPDVSIETNRLEDTSVSNHSYELIGLNDAIYQPEAESSDLTDHFFDEVLTMDNFDQLKDLTYLKNKFYIVDKRTDMTAADFDVEKFIQEDLSIDNTIEGPKILVFHTHSQELYSDSADTSEGVVGVGEYLCQLLEEKYGIQTMHDTQSYDIVDGKSQIMGAYEREEASIRKILKDNPSIQVAIDLHRDGVAETTRLVKNINGKPTAQIMFFNGLTKVYKDGTLNAIQSLPNPYLDTNLAFSFKMQIGANTLFPGLTRKVYLNAYRYSLHMLPKSLLVEVGAQTNTKEEAFNAMEPLANILAGVVLN